MLPHPTLLQAAVVRIEAKAEAAQEDMEAVVPGISTADLKRLVHKAPFLSSFVPGLSF